ncbi:MAG: hypothetical protein ACR2NP_15195 [Pirellulaceae bacterium]
MIGTAIVLGLAVSVVLTVLILASLAHNPRLWLGDAPKEMQKAATPLSKEERSLRIKWAVPILLVMVVVIPIVTFLIHQESPLSFVEAFGFMWIAWTTFNLVDLVIIDWLVVVRWRPDWSVIREVEHLYHLNTYWFHFKCFLIGTVVITIVSAILALFVVWF